VTPMQHGALPPVLAHTVTGARCYCLLGSVDHAACCAVCACVVREDVYDLLRPGSGALTIREDIRKGVYVEGLCERVVEDGESRALHCI
jgi:hypothetical protein